MAEENRFNGNVLKAPSVLLRFARLAKAEARMEQGKPKTRRNKKTGQDEPDLKFSVSAVLDPTNALHATVIEEVKAEATRALAHRYGSADPAKWPQRNPETGLGGLLYCFGKGNNLTKVYDGFKDMWYIKLSTPDYSRPSLWNRRHEQVVEGDPQFPYDGCKANVSFTLYTYDNKSRGVNGNLREVQFVQDGKAFTSGGRSGDDFAALGDEAPAAGGARIVDPFDE